MLTNTQNDLLRDLLLEGIDSNELIADQVGCSLQTVVNRRKQWRVPTHTHPVLSEDAINRAELLVKDGWPPKRAIRATQCDSYGLRKRLKESGWSRA